MLNRLHDFQSKNVFPPRLNVSGVYGTWKAEILKKISISYPNTILNMLSLFKGCNFDNFSAFKFNLDKL
jgi:hypothetical protein